MTDEAHRVHEARPEIQKKVFVVHKLTCTLKTSINKSKVMKRLKSFIYMAVYLARKNHTSVPKIFPVRVGLNLNKAENL